MRLRYGFYDFTVDKSKIYIESINYDGTFRMLQASFSFHFGDADVDPEP